MTAVTLEERVARIEKIFWAVGAVAVVFGVSGAWGLSVIRSAQDKIVSIQDDLVPIEKFVAEASDFTEDAKIAIQGERERQVQRIEPEIREMANNLISTYLLNRIAHEKTRNIRALGTHSQVTLPVKRGDLVHAVYTASARNSEFYYRIVEVGSISTKLTNSYQVIQVPDALWQSIAVQEVFRINSDGNLTLGIEFARVDVSGSVHVFESTLVASVVATAASQ